MKLNYQVRNFSSQDTHNLTINSPYQNVSYELLQYYHHTKWEMLKNKKHMIQRPRINQHLVVQSRHTYTCKDPQPHNHFKSNWNMWWSQKMTFFSIFYVFIQPTVGGLRWPAKHHDDGKKTGLHTQWLSHSLSLARAVSHTNTHFRSMHSMIHPSGGASSCINRAEIYFRAKAHLRSQARGMQTLANMLVSVHIHAERKDGRKKHTYGIPI